MPVAAARRRADGDEDGLRAAYCTASRSVVKESRPCSTLVAIRSVEAGLVDRRLAALERRDLALVLVDACHMVAEVGEQAPETSPT